MLSVNLRQLLFISIIPCISGCSFDNSQLSGGYSYDDQGGLHYRWIFPLNVSQKTFIYPDVVDFVFDDSFIIAAQIPDTIGYKSRLSFELYMLYQDCKILKDSPEYKVKPEWQTISEKVKNDTNIFKIFKDRKVSSRNSEEDQRISETIVDSLIRNDPYFKKIFSHHLNYWIINIYKDTLIGPLANDEYLKMRKTLGIPLALKLKRQEPN